jgi:predicted translin family RNA/ssDNA-binding protein
MPVDVKALQKRIGEFVTRREAFKVTYTKLSSTKTAKQMTREELDAAAAELNWLDDEKKALNALLDEWKGDIRSGKVQDMRSEPPQTGRRKKEKIGDVSQGSSDAR